LIIIIAVITISTSNNVSALSSTPDTSIATTTTRKTFITNSISSSFFAITTAAVTTSNPQLSNAYDPDPDKLRESLYLMSRVQEATVQQERLVNRNLKQEELKQKMKLSLRLVDRSYKLLDQINFTSQYEFLIESLQTTRNEIFTYVKYMPQDKLQEARLRIERENVDNREEFDGPSDAGVYNPVKLPWK